MKRVVKTFEQYSVYTNDKFWGTIGAGILPLCKENGKFLVPFRSEFVNEPNTYGVWGGKLDDMETDDPKKAAIQEFQEECGYTDKIKMIPSYVYEKNDQNGKNIFTYFNYIGIIENEFKPILNWETESYKWVSLEELYNIEPKHFGLEDLLENARKQIEEIYSSI